LEGVKAYWKIDPDTAFTGLEKSLSATRIGLEETRRILVALRAKPLDDFGLLPAIRSLAEDAAKDNKIDLELKLDNNVNNLPSAVEQCFYRVAQEAITNTIKHAKAKKLTVRLEHINNIIMLTVQDDGIGFNVLNIDKNIKFGLTGVKERVNSVNGKLSIISKPGMGTIIQVKV
jgi:signal transduction histidine kinase